MNYLIWRQHRTQVMFASASLGVFAVVVWITGTHMASTYRAAVAQCSAANTCSQTLTGVFRGDGAIVDLIALTLVVPALFGLFWGAPLIAREIEEGTHKLAWTQTVTRRHWYATKMAWIVGAAAAWGAAVSLLVMWWSRPENSLNHYRFEPAHFDVQGLVPIAYAVFAVSLGIAAGSLMRRTLPALAITAGGYVAVRLVIDIFVRPHYLAPVKKIIPLFSNFNAGSASNWVLSSVVRLPNGTTDRGISPDNPLVASCQSAMVDRRSMDACLTARGIREIVTYQPANRFWTFQGIEFAIFILLAAALLGVALILVTRRDA